MSKDEKQDHKNRINAGYEIFSAVKVENTEFVAGKNIHAPNQYVTWECTDGSNYFFGHYFSNRDNCMIDLYQRAENEMQYRRERVIERKDRAQSKDNGEAR